MSANDYNPGIAFDNAALLAKLRETEAELHDAHLETDGWRERALVAEWRLRRPSLWRVATWPLRVVLPG